MHISSQIPKLRIPAIAHFSLSDLQFLWLTTATVKEFND